MHLPSEGGGRGSLRTSQSQEPKISSGNWNVRAPRNRSCEKKSRDEEGKCTPPHTHHMLSPPTPSALGVSTAFNAPRITLAKSARLVSGSPLPARPSFPSLVTTEQSA